MHEEVVNIENYKTKVLENFKSKKPTIAAVDLDNMLIPFNYSNFWNSQGGFDIYGVSSELAIEVMLKRTLFKEDNAVWQKIIASIKSQINSGKSQVDLAIASVGIFEQTKGFIFHFLNLLTEQIRKECNSDIKINFIMSNEIGDCRKYDNEKNEVVYYFPKIRDGSESKIALNGKNFKIEVYEEQINLGGGGSNKNRFLKEICNKKTDSTIIFMDN